MNTVTFSIKDSFIGIIKLNRPDARNAMSKQLLQDFHLALDEVEKNKNLRVLIITGEGEKAFCAGADLKERAGMNDAETIEAVGEIGAVINRVDDLTIPTIAAINGAAFGGGLELSLACDIRIATDEAKMGLTETALGIIPGAGGTQRLPRLIGLAKATYYILTAKRFDSFEGKEIGLIQEIVPFNELMNEALAIAKQISNNGPIGVKSAKKAIKEGIRHDLKTGLAIERKNYLYTLPTEDRKEGLLAFKEKRKPNYKGR